LIELLKYTLRRLLMAVPVLLAVTILCTGMMSFLPGDAAGVALGVNATPEALAAKRTEFGLDKPFPARYASWASKAVRGDFGTSWTNEGVPVTNALKDSFPLSLTLAIFSIFLSLLISIPLGVYAAYRVGGRIDRIINSFVFASISIPGFVAGLAVLLLFAKLFTTESSDGQASNIFLRDYVPFTSNPISCLLSLFPAALSVSIGQSAGFLRIIRTDMATTLQDDYVLMAKSKGMSDKYILGRHAFRPSSFTLITVVGVAVGQLLGNLLIVEGIFGLNGLGGKVFGAITARDYPVTLGVVAIITIVFVVVTTLVDLLYGVIDPRVRFARKLA
jgi:peptide/nickel transport system permease protein